MKKKLYLSIILFFQLNLTVLFAVNIDTGWITYEQPDGTKFIGRAWGDEFEYYQETEDGFRFVKNHHNGYWCYAKLSKKGDFKATPHKAGIDDPFKYNLTKHLEFSDKYKDDIQKKREKFSEELARIRDAIKLLNPHKPTTTGKVVELPNLQTAATTRNVSVDLVLVEFQDVRHDPAYTDGDFDTMFGSMDYVGEGKHPEGKKVYGSVRAYWLQMTSGNVDINGSVWNSSSWILLDYDKIHYDTTSVFLTEVNAKSGYPTGSLNANHLRAILYAGNEYNGGELHPSSSGYTYKMAAEFSRPTGQGYDNWEDNKFANIGTHCHELGHAAFGLPDRYYSYNYNQWGLMAKGNKNGPANECACPAPLNPYDREDNGWISFRSFSGRELQKSFVYDYNSPHVYKIKASPTEFFLIENRQIRENAPDFSFDKYLPWHPDEGGLLIWQEFYGALDLIEADNDNGGGNAQKGDQFPGITDNRFLNDFTTPNSKLRNGKNSQLIVHNISDVGPTMYADVGLGWFGELPFSQTWEDTVKLAGDVTIPIGVAVTLAPGAKVKLNGHQIISSCGTVSPFIERLENGITLVALYPTLDNSITINSDITETGSISFSCDVNVENDAIFSLDNAQVVLNDSHLRVTDGTLSRGSNVTFAPDIRLIRNEEIIGQYSDITTAIGEAEPGDRVSIYFPVIIPGSLQIGSDITLHVAPGDSLELMEQIDIATGGRFIVDEDAYIKCHDHIQVSGGAMDIYAGARLDFDQYSKLKVNGELRAIGTYNKRITLTSHSYKWSGVYFDEDCDYNECVLEHCDLSLADFAVTCNSLSSGSGSGSGSSS